MRPRPADLASPEGQAIAAAAAALPSGDPLALMEALRRQFPGSDPDVVAAAATQARLRERARERLGPLAADFLLTDAGLQQASRWDVARYRAARLADRLRQGAQVADLTCGIGVDAYALADEGFRVTAFDTDSWTADAASINLADRAQVECADSTEVDLRDFDAAYVDPARRDPQGPSNAGGTRTRAEINPDHWSPAWPWVRQLARTTPVVAKVAPGLPTSRVPADAEIEWIAHDRDLVEACVWFAPLARGRRTATVVYEGGYESVADDGLGEDPESAVAAFLLEPSPAAVRAGLVGALARHLRVPRCSRTWLTSETKATSHLVVNWRVIDEVDPPGPALRARIRDAGSVTFKTRDAGFSSEEARRRTGHRPARGGAQITIAVLRRADGEVAYVIEPAGRPQRSR